MLVPVPERAAVVACSTCRREGSTLRDGPALVAALRAVGAETGYGGIAVEEMPCLFACRSACAVHLRAPGRLGYVLGGFAPGEDAARSILDFAVRYAASEEGQVPYRDWPEGVKGHFLVRVPPAGFLVR